MTANTPRPSPASSASRIASALSGDPDMVELIQLFVEEIPERVRLVQDFWERRDLNELKRLAHEVSA